MGRGRKVWRSWLGKACVAVKRPEGAVLAGACRESVLRHCPGGDGRRAGRNLNGRSHPDGPSDVHESSAGSQRESLLSHRGKKLTRRCGVVRRKAFLSNDIEHVLYAGLRV